MAKYLPKQLMVTTNGPIPKKGFNVYATVITEVSSGSIIFSVYFDNQSDADALSASIARSFQSSADVIEIP